MPEKRPLETWEIKLIDWQNRECKGCTFADDPKIGTGKFCCTHAGRISIAVATGLCETKEGKTP